MLVLLLNGYSPRLGFFRDRVMPLCNYLIATEPLSKEQWQLVGWQHRQGITDMHVLFDYQRPTADGGIVIGGSGAAYFASDAPSSGNYKPTIELLTEFFRDLSAVGRSAHRRTLPGAARWVSRGTLRLRSA